MNKISKIISLATMFGAVVLTGCTQRPPQTEVMLQAAHYLNPDINGRPSPVVVNIYQLKNPYSFKQGTYATLSKNPAAVLGNDLIDKQTVEVRPGSSKSINLLLSNETKYIGVIADYRNIDNAKWQDVIKLEAVHHSMFSYHQAGLLVNLQSQGVSASLTN